MTVLAFPHLKDFLQYCEARQIRELGQVIRQDVKAGKDGISWANLCYRFSAVSTKSGKPFILRCDVSFYRGLWMGAEATREEAKEDEEKIKMWINGCFKLVPHPQGWDILEAEFQEGDWQ